MKYLKYDDVPSQPKLKITEEDISHIKYIIDDYKK